MKYIVFTGNIAHERPPVYSRELGTHIYCVPEADVVAIDRVPDAEIGPAGEVPYLTTIRCGLNLYGTRSLPDVYPDLETALEEVTRRSSSLRDEAEQRRQREAMNDASPEIP